MYIDEVRLGETLADFAVRNGTGADRITELNGLTTQEVVQGLALLVPPNRYLVRPGDSLWRIAHASGVTVEELQRANPGAERTLYPGRPLRIPAPVKRAAEVIGYLPLTDPGVRAADIQPWARQLTWVAIFSHLLTEEGDLPPIDDTGAIQATYAAGAKPLMSIANMKPGGAFSPEIARSIITDPAVRSKVISGILQTVTERGYAGVDSDIENIPRELRTGYVDFLRELKSRLGEKPLNVAVPPKYDEETFAYARGHDYAGIGRVADRVYLMNYEFHWVGGPPGAVAPLPQVRRVMQYAASLMPAAKIMSGISTTAYDWELPDTPENKARPWSDDRARDIAIEHKSRIRYDEPAQTPWFRYSNQGPEHEVWFEDARSIAAKMEVIRDLGLCGTGIWHLGAKNSQLPPIIDQFFAVQK